MRTILLFNGEQRRGEFSENRWYMCRERDRLNHKLPDTNARLVGKGKHFINVARDIDGQLALDLPPSHDMSDDWKEL